jgi:hypothetical protein
MYTVEFVLAKPDARNAPENEFRFADQRRGDSHLAIAKPAVIIDIDPTEVLLHFQSPSSPALVFHGFPNDAGYLAKLKSDPFHASNRGEAEKIASTAMRSLLSSLSAQLDIPLIIELVEVMELATKASLLRHHFRSPVWLLMPEKIRMTESCDTPWRFIVKR